ncbi:MAG: ABC transporter ATP-binding protein [Beijerinckiaceae bacterium]|nr:ABC transporter ATP-binding protein [Beijerinckiaceae bacterium]
MTDVLKIRDLNKSFGGIVVANNIDLDLRAGRVLGLIGPNGAGKTSLFNLVTGVVKPDSGSITLNGDAIDALPIYQRARRGLARTWQNLRLFPSLSVLDNVLLGPRDYPGEKLQSLIFDARGVARRQAENTEKAHRVLQRTGLGAVAHSRVQDIPYGQQKLVGVARALMNDARCLLLDEPMAGVEGQAYAAIQRVVRDIAESGVAVCVVEHNVAFVRDLCDEGVFMFAGKVLARGSVTELIADPRLTELYFGT